MCRIPYAKPGRESVDFEIFGMAGIPEGMEPGTDPIPGLALNKQSAATHPSLPHPLGFLFNMDHRASSIVLLLSPCLHSIDCLNSI